MQTRLQFAMCVCVQRIEHKLQKYLIDEHSRWYAVGIKCTSTSIMPTYKANLFQDNVECLFETFH